MQGDLEKETSSGRVGYHGFLVVLRNVVLPNNIIDKYSISVSSK